MPTTQDHERQVALMQEEADEWEAENIPEPEEDQQCPEDIDG